MPTFLNKYLNFLQLNTRKSSQAISCVCGMLIMFLWVVMLCGQKGRHSCFRLTWRQYVSLKHFVLPMRPQGVTTQKNVIIFNAVRTSNIAVWNEFPYRHG
jgi:hypothetical protein